MTRYAAALLLLLSAPTAHATQVSGFMCREERAIESMLELHAKGDHAGEDALGKTLIARGVYSFVPLDREFEAVEVYRGKVVRTKGGAPMQVVGFAQLRGAKPEIYGFMTVLPAGENEA